MSLRGYWRTLRERIDWSPAIRITRLTTIARTGRLTKRSVNLLCMARVLFFSVLLPPFPVRREGREESAWPDYSRTPHPIPPHVGGGNRYWHPGPALEHTGPGLSCPQAWARGCCLAARRCSRALQLRSGA